MLGPGGDRKPLYRTQKEFRSSRGLVKAPVPQCPSVPSSVYRRYRLPGGGATPPLSVPQRAPRVSRQEYVGFGRTRDLGVKGWSRGSLGGLSRSFPAATRDTFPTATSRTRSARRSEGRFRRPTDAKRSVSPFKQKLFCFIYLLGVSFRLGGGSSRRTLGCPPVRRSWSPGRQGCRRADADALQGDGAAGHV